MMRYELRNSRLSAEFSTKGAELLSLRDEAGTEYIWQGSEDTWKRSAPTLFPIIGGMKEGKYLYEGKEYDLSKHGFLRDKEAHLDYYDNTRISFTFKSDESTRVNYPFDFEMTVVYELSRDRLVVRYLVKNTDEKDMYFALGFHPGFNLPLGEGCSFEDYYLDFHSKDSNDTRRVEITLDGFLTGNYSDFSEDRLYLSREIFENEAIILEKPSKSLTLSSENDCKEIFMDFPDMNYLAIWTLPDKRAEYICIEPWSSLVGEDKGVVEIKDIKGIVKLAPNEFYKNEISMQILDK